MTGAPKRLTTEMEKVPKKIRHGQRNYIVYNTKFWICKVMDFYIDVVQGSKS
jgi:hypothetical protein